MSWVYTAIFLSASSVVCFKFLLLFLNFMCMGIFIAHMSLHHVCVVCPWRLEEGFRSHENGIIVVCEPPYGYWDLNSDPLEE